MREQNGTGGAGASTESDGKGASSSSKKGGAANTNSAASAAAKPSADEKEEKLVRMVRLWGLGGDSLRNSLVSCFASIPLFCVTGEL